MKFTNILRNIIVEATKYETLLDALTKPTKDKEGKKKKALLSKEVYHELVKGDPTTRLNDVDLDTEDKDEIAKVKAGNYVQWLVKQYLNVSTEAQPGEPTYDREFKQSQSVFIEDLYKVTNDLMKFDRFKNRIPQESRDINKLNVQQLYELVKDFSLEKTKATKDEKKAASETYEHPGGKIAFRGSNWTVVEISDTGKLGKDAACFYGGNYLEPSKGETRWCTSSPGLNWFDRYIKDGPLYVVIPNNYEGKRGESSGLPAERYQFHFQSNQFMDVHDHSVNLVELLNGPMSELKDYFKPEFAKGVTVGGTKFAVDSFSSGAVGKFVALYGVEDLFTNLPPELEEFQINNRDSNNVIVRIPEDIGKFKNLKMILLENCIAEIPESVCQLTKLRFIALINNPQLKTVPGCLVNLPNLTFINLKGSTNVEVPEEIKARAVDVGGGMWDLEGED
jgi:Leucine-rich repeat (LRR) protein